MRSRSLALCLLGVALAAAAMPAHADQDAVQFFNDINVTPNQPVKDAVCFFCSVGVDGNVNGDIVVFFGSVRLNGMAHHDVVNFFGSVSAADNSYIGGDLVSFFGSVQLGENVSVRKDVVAMFGVVHSPTSVSIGHNRVMFSPLIIFGPLLVVFLIIFLIVHEVRVHRMRQYMQHYPMPPRQ
ncbi:conserved exported hypothetical protein [Candidatus Sulfotelmatomonas gaucii]|uniref:Uncharacterized protein n=1 Tax=Candidatus Sulfuritelmatomonas gaucii TaxID=2043161 RepID=A0A2N9L4N2_9BACT|nr:conserved exported hypothetical protein [Candidatus Sulfotelmatomonas gaucii]